VDISLGVSMTPTAVRMVLVEGENAKGITVDHDVFEVASDGTSATASERVLSAILGTRESAEEGGHRLVSTVVAWRDHDDAAALRDALAARNIAGVMLVSELHAAGALAEAVGAAMGYERTALLFIDADTATLSVVETADGSIIRVQRVDTDDEGDEEVLAALTSAVAALEHLDAPPQGVFVVGSGASVSAIKDQLAAATCLPVSAPDEPELALARGAALAGPRVPLFEAATVGREYASDDEGTTAQTVHPAAGSSASALAYSEVDPNEDPLLVDAAVAEPPPGSTSRQGRKPFLVGSAMTGIFVVGVGALVVSLAVSIRPTGDQQPSPAQSVIVPTQTQMPAAAVPTPPAPPPETIQAPVPVVQEARQPQAPVRTVYVDAPAARVPAAVAPAPAAPAPAPAAVAPAPAAPAPAPAASAPIPAAPAAPAPEAAVPVPAAPALESVPQLPALPDPAAPAVLAPDVPAPVIVPRLPTIKWPWDRSSQQQVPQLQIPQFPQQAPQWVPPSQKWPDWDPPQPTWPQQSGSGRGSGDSGFGPGSGGSGSGRGSGGFGPGSGGSTSGSRGGNSPVWPWPSWGQ
jgi:hypothetical protein